MFKTLIKSVYTFPSNYKNCKFKTYCSHILGKIKKDLKRSKMTEFNEPVYLWLFMPKLRD